MKKLILIIIIPMIGCQAETKEYRAFYDKHNTTSTFYCSGGSLINEYFIDINATKPSYRNIVINNETVKCNIKEGFLIIPDLNIKVKVKE